jgi:hypothetical protein
MHLVGQLATSKLLLGVYYFDFTKKPCIIIREQQKKIQFTMQERERRKWIGTVTKQSRGMMSMEGGSRPS